MALPLLTASRLKDARACQRLHRMKYIDGYRPVDDAETLRFGKLVHTMLEAWWRASDERLDAALAAVAGAECDPFDLARARAMLIGYDARWSGEQLETLGVEVEFRAPLINPETGAASRTWQLGGKIDAIARTPDGRVLLVEHKTSAEDVSPGSSYWARLRLDGQISVYYEGAASLGFDVQGVIYDVLGKPALRPYKVNQKRKVDETPEEFFQRCVEAIAEDPARYLARGEVVRLEADMVEALTDVWQIGRSLKENENAGRFPRNVDSCFKYGRPCAFWDVCAGQASLDDARRFRRIENIHPELEDANGAA
jgi:hypothetical protein